MSNNIPCEEHLSDFVKFAAYSSDLPDICYTHDRGPMPLEKPRISESSFSSACRYAQFQIQIQFQI